MTQSQEMHSGFIGVGEKETDFLLGDDVRLGVDISAPETPDGDRVFYTLNQNQGPFTQGCTFLSTLAGLCSYWNKEVTEKDMYGCLEVAKADGYKVGKGWRTQMGVNSTTKYWNATYRDMKSLYTRTMVGSKEFNEGMRKNLSIVFSRRSSKKHTYDIAKDGVVNSKSFDDATYGHAIFGTKSLKYDLYHVNTYLGSAINEYEVQYLDELVESQFYFAAAYVLMPDMDSVANELKKKKLIEQSMANNSKIYNMGVSDKTKEVLSNYNSYFRSVGFENEKE